MYQPLISATEFATRLRAEYDVQDAKPTSVANNYRKYAVENALSLWEREYGHLTDVRLLMEAYRAFQVYILRASSLPALQTNSVEGYKRVLVVLSGVGVKF